MLIIVEKKIRDNHDENANNVNIYNKVPCSWGSALELGQIQKASPVLSVSNK